MNPMPQSSRPTPPLLAECLLEWCCAPELLEEVQGDLHERFHRRVALFGERSARRQYVWEVLGFITKPFAIKRQPNPYPTPTNMDMLRNYLKIAYRNLTKHKASTLINLSGLTLGVTACLVIYVITSFELGFDTFHPDGERIYRMVGTFTNPTTGEKSPMGFVPNAVPKAVREEISGFETVAAFHNIESEVLIPNGREKPKQFDQRKHGVDNAEIIIVEPQYFDIFKYQWLAGNPQTALREPFKMVLSEKKARTYFGDLPPDQVLGKEVIYWDSIRVSVAGVVKDWDQSTDLTFTDFISFPTIRASAQMKRSINLDEWNDIWSASQAFVKLPEGATTAQFAPAFRQFAQRHFPKNFNFELDLQPLSDLHFDADYGDNYARKAHLPTLYGLMGVAVFILLIAAINFINLSTAQSVERAKEVGIRKVLGSSRRSLIGQFMSETFILTALAVVTSLLLVKPILTSFQSFIPAGVDINPTAPRVLVFLGALTILTMIMAGLYPSLALASYRPVITLKGQNALLGNQKGRLRQGLIVFQFTVSLVFIIGTIIVGRQLNFMRNKDLGFRSDAVLVLSPPKGAGNKLSVLYDKVRQLSGVQKATLQVLEPMGISYGLDKVTYKGKTVQTLEAAYKMGDENYIPFYEMKLLAGRTLVKSDSSRELVVNESFVKALGFKQPAEALNKSLQWRDKLYPIVGVVADFHQQSMHEKIAPTFITTVPYARDLAVKLSHVQGEQFYMTLGEIRQLWQEVYPDTKFEYSFMDDTLAQFYEKEQKTARLVNTATAIAILISCLGLFGLATFTAQQRTKEIGVRKVLGASVSSIIALLSADFIRLVFIAILIASPVAWWATDKWLQDFAYKADITWWVFVLAGLLAMGIALLTVSFQSVKAALMDPAKSLRTE